MSPVIKLSSQSPREFLEITVLYEDEHLMILDKPSGLLVSSDRLEPGRPNLMQLLHDGIAQEKPWAKERGLGYLRITHRLDAEATGIAIFAKTKDVLIKLREAFGIEQPGIRYLALVREVPSQPEFEVDAKIAPNPARPGVMKVDSHHGKRSRSLFKVIEKFSRYALLSCEPLTDRAHQVRVHLRNAGFPIVGDQPYGGKPLLLSRLKPDYRLKEARVERPLISRPALHCEQVLLPHPVTNEPLAISAPRPKDIEVGLKYLRRYGAAAGEMTLDTSSEPIPES